MQHAAVPPGCHEDLSPRAYFSVAEIDPVGRVNENVLPLPTSLSTRMRPP